MTRPHSSRLPLLPIGAAALAISGALLTPPAALAQGMSGPVVCTSSLEAAPTSWGRSDATAMAPVEVTRCNRVQTTSELVEQRYFSYTSPFARGIDITHQITDVLGIAMGGGDGTRVMGLGFPDQTMVWDGSALGNLYDRLIDAQHTALPVRSPDLSNPYRSSLLMSSFAPRPVDPTAEPMGTGGGLTSSPTSAVRGLW